MLRAWKTRIQVQATSHESILILVVEVRSQDIRDTGLPQAPCLLRRGFSRLVMYVSRSSRVPFPT